MIIGYREILNEKMAKACPTMIELVIVHAYASFMMNSGNEMMQLNIVVYTFHI